MRLRRVEAAGRVWVGDVKDLTTSGPEFLRYLGAKCTTWDTQLGRNSNEGRLLKRRAAEASKRRSQQTPIAGR